MGEWFARNEKGYQSTGWVGERNFRHAVCARTSCDGNDNQKVITEEGLRAVFLLRGYAGAGRSRSLPREQTAAMESRSTAGEENDKIRILESTGAMACHTVQIPVALRLQTYWR